MVSASPLVLRPYRSADHDEVVALWQRCNLVVPANDPTHDIALKLAFQPSLFFVGTIDERIVATVMAGYEGHRGWINYLAVSPEAQRRGLGRQVMAHAEEALRQLGCPKANLQVRASNTDVVKFYERLGFTIEDRVSMGKRLSS